MKGSLRIGSVAGAGVFLHWSFLVLFGWLFAAQVMHAGWTAAIQTGVFIVAVFVCVTLHEIGHATMALRFGIRTRDITLLPIGGVARLNRIPEEPRRELMIALAGPVVNVVIAAALGAGMLAHGVSFRLDEVRLTESAFLNTMFWFNVIVVAFNMIPAFPMDGGRVFRAVLASRQNYQDATRHAALFGQIIAGLFIVAGLYVNFMLTIIGVFVFFSAAAEARAVAIRAIATHATAFDAMIARLHMLSGRDTLGDAVDLLLSGSQTDIPVVLDNDRTGILTRLQLLKGLRRHGPSIDLSNVVCNPACSVAGDLPLDQAMEKMADERGPVLVMNALGEVIGMLTPAHVQEWLMIENVLQERDSGRSTTKTSTASTKDELFHIHT